jgi:peroxiredoxin
MANNSEVDLQSWVDKRLDVLHPDGRWQPNAVSALSRLRAQCAGSTPFAWKSIGLWTTTTLAAATVLFFSLATPAPRVLAQRCVDCSVALWQSISPSARVRAELAPEKDRKAATDFVLSDAAGKSVKLSSWKGRVVLLNFWATWCSGCKTEMPWFVELQTQYRDSGLNAIGVSLDQDGWKSVTPYLNEHGVNYTIVVGPPELGKQYGVEALPVTLLIDRDGRIAVTHVGLVPKPQYQAEIEALLAEKSSDKIAVATARAGTS